MSHNFDEILCAVREWADRVPFSPELLRDDQEGLRIIWETEAHLAELIVRRGEYAPYRYVSFQLLDIRLAPDQALVYSYHDQEGSSVSEILSALDRGIDPVRERRETHA